jgi:4-oxalocrotonate tautomerase family enzyme
MRRGSHGRLARDPEIASEADTCHGMPSAWIGFGCGHSAGRSLRALLNERRALEVCMSVVGDIVKGAPREKCSMPYIHAAIAYGCSREKKRSLIRAITTSTVCVLEVPPADVHVFLWEFATQNLGYGGEEPSRGKINNVTVIVRRGRHRGVRLALLKGLTDAVQSVLGVTHEDIHVILSEVPPENIGEGGVPMGPPTQPDWHTTLQRKARHALESDRS